MVQRTPLRFQIAHPPRPRSRPRSYFYSGPMMRRTKPTAISSREGPPTRRELAPDALPSSSVEKHCVLSPNRYRMSPYHFRAYISTSYNVKPLSLSPHNTLSARWQATWKPSAPTPLNRARYVTRKESCFHQGFHRTRVSSNCVQLLPLRTTHWGINTCKPWRVI